jgi:hypothetical protein
VPIVVKSRSLALLELSRPVQGLLYVCCHEYKLHKSIEIRRCHSGTCQYWCFTAVGVSYRLRYSHAGYLSVCNVLSSHLHAKYVNFNIINQSLLLFQLNAHNMLNTYMCHSLPPKCFGVCYTIFREIIALFAQELYAFCNVVTVGCSVKCNTYVVLYNLIHSLCNTFYSTTYETTLQKHTFLSK